MIKLFSVVCLVSVQIHHSKSNYNYRVQEGRDVVEGTYPYVVVLSILVDKEYNRMCTGSMITETWGMTAAHCSIHKIDPSLAKNYYVTYDNFTQSPLESGCYVPIIKMLLHPSHRSLSTNGGRNDLVVNNDISLFRSGKVPKKSYAVLSAVDYSTLIGLPVVFVGGGRSKDRRQDSDKFKPLQFGEATIIACDEEMRKLSRFVICLAPKCSNRLQTSWYGDSGGPLIYDGKIIGVCSFGIENKIIRRFGYAPVSPYIDWIHHVMNVTVT